MAASCNIDNKLVVNYVFTIRKEDLNRALPHLRLSSENWSGRFVGRT